MHRSGQSQGLHEEEGKIRWPPCRLGWRSPTCSASRRLSVMSQEPSKNLISYFKIAWILQVLMGDFKNESERTSAKVEGGGEHTGISSTKGLAGALPGCLHSSKARREKDPFLLEFPGRFRSHCSHSEVRQPLKRPHRKDLPLLCSPGSLWGRWP